LFISNKTLCLDGLRVQRTINLVCTNMVKHITHLVCVGGEVSGSATIYVGIRIDFPGVNEP
jgi:hypothetical protein